MKVHHFSALSHAVPYIVAIKSEKFIKDTIINNCIPLVTLGKVCPLEERNNVEGKSLSFEKRALDLLLSFQNDILEVDNIWETVH